MTYIQKIYNFDYLVFTKKFPGFDLRLNQIQGVHLKFINILLINSAQCFFEIL